MKTAIRKAKLLMYGLALALSLYNCQTKEVESLTPFSYTFKEFSEVKLKDITPETPVAVVTKEATITASAEAADVNNGLNSIATVGMTASVKAAADNVKKVVSAEKTEALLANFTPDVIQNLLTTGTIAPALQTEMSAIANNPAMKAYLPKYTMPEVSGQPVSFRQSAPADQPIVVARVTASGPVFDACVAAAQTQYTKSLQTLDAAKAAQINTINTLYNQTLAVINSNEPDCSKGARKKYADLRNSLSKSFKNSMDAIDANKKELGTANYNAIRLFYLSTYVETLSIYLRLELVELSSCRLSKNAKIAATEAARAKSLAVINENYNDALATLNKTLAKAIASCHNQGGGQ